MSNVAKRDYLSPVELRSAIEGLPKIALDRLEKMAVPLAPGTAMEPNDLLQEAVMRCLEDEGGRNCPRELEPEIFLRNVMRSIASHARDKRAGEVPLDAQDDHDDDLVFAMPDSKPSPEDATSTLYEHQKLVSQIESMFADDSQAQAVAISLMEGWLRADIIEMEAMSDQEYDAARKRVRRALQRNYSRKA